MDKPPIRYAVQNGDIVYWAHYADHCDFNAPQRQAARHLRESMHRLLRYRDRLDEIRNTFPVSAVSGLFRPTSEQQHRLFDATQDFYQTFYATLSAWAGFLARVYGKLGPTTPPTASMKQFIEWLSAEQPIFEELGYADELEDARRFRTILDHSGQAQPFDWATHDAGREHPTVYISLFGPSSRAGRGPIGSSSGGPIGDNGWYFIAPDEVSVANCLAKLYEIFMPRLLPVYALPDGTEVTCPDFPWEREWRRSKAPYAEPLSPYIAGGPTVNLETQSLIKSALTYASSPDSSGFVCPECGLDTHRLEDGGAERHICPSCGSIYFF
jgi:hypothetical protein